MKPRAWLLVLMIGFISTVSCFAITTIAEESKAENVCYDVGDTSESIVMSVVTLEDVFIMERDVNCESADKEQRISELTFVRSIKTSTAENWQLDKVHKSVNDVGKYRCNYYVPDIYKNPRDGLDTV